MKYLAYLFFLQCLLVLAAIQCGRELAPGPTLTPTPSEAPTPKPTKTAKPGKEKALFDQNAADVRRIEDIMRGVE